MTTIARNILNRAVNGFKNHIVKCADDDKYAAKALLLTTVGLNMYSNVVDYYQLKRNDDIKGEEKQYLQAFRITDGLVSAVTQTAAGLAIISDKAQGAIIKGISKFYKGFDKTLNKTGRRHLLKLTSLIGAIAITKRILTPLIVTPVASWANKNIRKHREEEKEPNFSGREKLNQARKFYGDVIENDDEKLIFESKFKESFDYLKKNRENIYKED